MLQIALSVLTDWLHGPKGQSRAIEGKRLLRRQRVGRELRLMSFATRRLAQLLSAGGVIVRSAKKWNRTGAHESVEFVVPM
jgi:hypothetical protein